MGAAAGFPDLKSSSLAMSLAVNPGFSVFLVHKDQEIVFVVCFLHIAFYLDAEEV